MCWRVALRYTKIFKEINLRGAIFKDIAERKAKSYLNTVIGIDETKYTGGSFTTNSQTISLDYQGAGTYYLHVLTVDKVGHKKENISEPISDNQAK